MEKEINWQGIIVGFVVLLVGFGMIFLEQTRQVGLVFTGFGVAKVLG